VNQGFKEAKSQAMPINLYRYTAVALPDRQRRHSYRTKVALLCLDGAEWLLWRALELYSSRRIGKTVFNLLRRASKRLSRLGLRLIVRSLRRRIA
jgi:hypothetical protein